MMTMFTKSGEAKLVPACSYPLTGVGCVSRVYTDLATVLVGPDGPVVTETFGVSFEELQARLDVSLQRLEDRG